MSTAAAAGPPDTDEVLRPVGRLIVERCRSGIGEDRPVGFFDRDEADGADGDFEARTDALARMARGGIPAEAEARLRGLGRDGSLFTSGLSVGGFALLGAMEMRPLAQVMGASVVHVGPQLLPALPVRVVRGEAGRSYAEPALSQRLRFGWEQPVVCELGQLSQAWKLARRRAFGRLLDEAQTVDADVVVGVRLDRAALDVGEGTIDLVVTGTAVRVPGGGRSNAPIFTDLSAQEFWQLHRAGVEPAGLILETCVVFAAPARRTRWERTRAPRQNREFDELSDGFHLARERVRDGLRDAVVSARGDGMVGVQLSHSVREGEFEHRASLPRRQSTGWHRGSLGIPYYFSGAGEISRSGWVITMHGAGTALRRGGDCSADGPEPALGMGSR